MVLLKRYDVPPVRRSEILRYAGALGSDGELDGLLDSCLSEISGQLSALVCYTELDVTVSDGTVCLGNIRTDSASFRKYISGCDRAVVFAATVGIAPDRLIRRYGRLSPAKALMFDAIGSERVESLCDAFCADVKRDAEQRGYSALPRFSPGYGDLPLGLQKDIFALLECEKKIGVTLGDSLLMTPSKSVTAFIPYFSFRKKKSRQKKTMMNILLRKP